MMQEGSDLLLELVAALFNGIMKLNVEPPEEWRMTFMKVIFKKGDARLPDNYRPISMLPIFYKLLSRIICTRIKSTLEGAQSRDQAGFRSGFCCGDYLFTVTILSDLMNEFGRPLWICAVDYRKAFDSVERSSM